MPLSIECVCPGATNMSVCQLVSAQFQVDASYVHSDWEAEVGIALLDGPGGVWITGTPLPDFTGGGFGLDFSASSDLDIVDLLANWDTMVVRYSIVSGLFQPLTDGKFASWSATWRIKMVFQCIDSDGRVVTRTRYAFPTVSDVCIEDWPGFIRSTVSGGGGGGVGILYNSSIFTPATCTINLGTWEPKPRDNGIDIANSVPNLICFCASGGTEPYLYSYTGTLPDGLGFDPGTGCLTGAVGGEVMAASTEITVTVTDALQDQASVTCTLFQNCGSGESVGNSFY